MIVIAGVAGLLLGSLFFAGLWVTGRWIQGRARPGLWLVGSFVVRASILLAGLWWVGHGDGGRMVACGLGILASRWLVIPVARRIGSVAR